MVGGVIHQHIGAERLLIQGDKKRWQALTANNFRTCAVPPGFEHVAAREI
jgi:hypothetical protein